MDSVELMMQKLDGMSERKKKWGVEGMYVQVEVDPDAVRLALSRDQVKYTDVAKVYKVCKALGLVD